MTEQERVQAADAEYNQFVTMLQARYGVLVRACRVTVEVAGENPQSNLQILIKPNPDWQPLEPPSE